MSEQPTEFRPTTEEASYRSAVAALPFGKKLPDAIYLHRDGFCHLPLIVSRAIDKAEKLAGTCAYNIVKLSLREFLVSLLAYPRFIEDAFPQLEEGWAVDLVTGQTVHRKFGGQNPPILHRKEMLLPPNHIHISQFSALTNEAEKAGLFTNSKNIGRKQAWESRLATAGLRVEGHSLLPLISDSVRDATATEKFETVHRHRTAIARHAFSTPVQALWRHNYLDGRFSVLDYGCGRGDDVRALQAQGIEARGWDPHFEPDTTRVPADVVNLGFVLNVIEEPIERAAALRSAYALTQRLLCVAVIAAGRETAERVRPWRDGVLTSRGTFQKTYHQEELRTYLFSVLNREPIAVGPGIFFVFRDDTDEQSFLVSRQRSAPCPLFPQRSTRPQTPKISRQPKLKKPSLGVVHADLLESLWSLCLNLGREPGELEVIELPRLREAFGSLNRALRFMRQVKDNEDLKKAQSRRMGDLLVYLALNLVERRRSASTMVETLRRDIRAFWGSYAKAKDEASQLLFSVGRPETILEGCRSAAAEGLGHLDGEHSLTLSTSAALRLPPTLRVYLSCAMMLYGDVEGADLVKLHVLSGKVTFLSYRDFDTSPLPILVERVKVDMRRQEVHFYKANEDRQQVLFYKSKYLMANDSNLARQQHFDDQLTKLALFDLSGFGPDEKTVKEHLARAGLEISGFIIRKFSKHRGKKSVLRNIEHGDGKLTDTLNHE